MLLTPEEQEDRSTQVEDAGQHVVAKNAKRGKRGKQEKQNHAPGGNCRRHSHETLSFELTIVEAPRARCIYKHFVIEVVTLW